TQPGPGALQGSPARRDPVDAVRAPADLRADAEAGLLLQAPPVHGAPDRGPAQPRLPVPGAAAGAGAGRAGWRGAGARAGHAAGGAVACAVDADLPAADAEAHLRAGLADDAAQVCVPRLLLLAADRHRDGRHRGGEHRLDVARWP